MIFSACFESLLAGIIDDDEPRDKRALSLTLIDDWRRALAIGILGPYVQRIRQPRDHTAGVGVVAMS
jgi:hypothetical protein